LIAVPATALGIAVSEYLLVRQDVAITRAPLLLPIKTLAAAVAKDVQGDWWIVLFWLSRCWLLPRRRLRTSSPSSPAS
jgi:hypothetical protein